MPREHWTTVRRTTSPLFTWVSRRVSISYAYTYTHGPRCVEKPLCCFPRFSLDGQWTYRRISFDLIDRRSLLVISSSRSPVKSRSTLSRNWPERSRNVVYLRLTRLVWVVFSSNTNNNRARENAFVYIQPFSSRRSRPRQRTTSPLFEGQIVQGRSSYRPKRLGRVFSPSFSDFLLLSRSRFDIGRFIELMGLRRGTSGERGEGTEALRFYDSIPSLPVIHIPAARVIAGECITIRKKRTNFKKYKIGHEGSGFRIPIIDFRWNIERCSFVTIKKVKRRGETKAFEEMQRAITQSDV